MSQTNIDVSRLGKPDVSRLDWAKGDGLVPAIVQHADEQVVRSAAEVTEGEALTVRFAEDQVGVIVGQPPG